MNGSVEVFPEAEWSAHGDEVVDRGGKSDVFFYGNVGALKDGDTKSSGDKRRR